MQPATLIFNPMAGPADCKAALAGVTARFAEAGWAVTVMPTERGGHATELARQAVADGVRLVIAAGGDGTLREVANGLAFTDTALAPLPMGTGNSFAKELKMARPRPFQKQRQLLRSVDSLIRGQVQQIDLGRAENDNVWLLWTGAGADGQLVRRIEPRSKTIKRFGATGYLLQGLAVMRDVRGWDATVTIDNRQVQGRFLLVVVSNCRMFGGGELPLNPGAQLDDGRFEVWLFEGDSFLELWRLLFKMRAGRHHGDAKVRMLSGRRVRVVSAEMPWHTDGDPAGMTPFTCDILPAALNLLVPDSAPRTLFSKKGVLFSDF